MFPVQEIIILNWYTLHIQSSQFIQIYSLSEHKTKSMYLLQLQHKSDTDTGLLTFFVLIWIVKYIYKS